MILLVRLFFMLLMISFFSSCYRFEYEVLKDVKLVGDIKRCRIRCYNLNRLKTVSDSKCGENFKSGNYPVEECDRIIGFDPGRVAKEIRPMIIKNKEYCESLESNDDYYNYKE